VSDEGQGSGWQPLTRPDLGGRPEVPEESNVGRRINRDGSLIISPFVRLARTHAFHAAGEASVFVTLAGTLLSIDPNDARSRILLALVLTMAPFAVVGPLIGPALDRIRGGRRATIVTTLLLRAALMVLMISNLDTSWFFPIAFVWLVLGKTYSVAKAATVPTTVDDEDELVEKNSRLAILSAVAGVAGVAPAALLYRVFGSTPTLTWAAIIYLCGVVAAIRMPRVVVDDPTTDEDDLDIRSEGVRSASIVMAGMRGIVGFVFFLLVFEFVRSELPDLSGIGTAVGAAVKSGMGFDLIEDPPLPAWQAAIPFGLWGFGGFAGNVIAPWFRKRFSEEKILVGAVVSVAVSAIAAVWAGGIAGASLVALIVGSSASAAKLAFDSLVQRDAPGANHGAAFGRFETSFQIAWVVGSLIAVIGPFPFRGIRLDSFPLRAGFLVVAIAAVALSVFITQGFGTGAMSLSREVTPGADGSARPTLRERLAQVTAPSQAQAAEQSPSHSNPAPSQAQAVPAQPVPNQAVPQQPVPAQPVPNQAQRVPAQSAPYPPTQQIPVQPAAAPAQRPAPPAAPAAPPVQPGMPSASSHSVAPPSWVSADSHPDLSAGEIDPEITPPFGIDPLR